MSVSDQVAPTERHQFRHDGRVIYEWNQTLHELNIYVQAPPGVRAKQLAVTITSSHLSISVAGNPPYLNHDLAGRVKPSESFWTLEDGEIVIQLCKADKGETWVSALAGHAVDLVTQEEERKRLLLERFQAEHPGFDFSGAEFNGAAPDAQSFMGGMPSGI